ncbi:transposase [Streptomyces aureocirculatus]|uniref:transposase n=1 Tax=Streptomyces aureocirculatus TaxID=67275 RepID=UPI0038512E80
MIRGPRRLLSSFYAPRSDQPASFGALPLAGCGRSRSRCFRRRECDRNGGGTASTPDKTLFAAIAYVLVSGCAWRQLPPCFGISKSTAHRRFLIWSRADVWGRLHEAVLHQLDGAGLIDVTRVVLDTAHVRAKKGANTQVRATWTGASRVPRCTSCRTRTDIGVHIARKGIESSERLGRRRWVIERTLSWLTGYRRLSPRYERQPANYLAFLGLAAALCCYKRLLCLTT